MLQLFWRHQQPVAHRISAEGIILNMILSNQKTTGPGLLDTAQMAPHILLVDDDRLICQQLHRLFTQEGYRATVTSSAEQALELLQNEDIDLVITDIRLPGIDGVELTRRIAERWADIPIIIMTGICGNRECSSGSEDGRQ